MPRLPMHSLAALCCVAALAATSGLAAAETPAKDPGIAVTPAEKSDGKVASESVKAPMSPVPPSADGTDARSGPTSEKSATAAPAPTATPANQTPPAAPTESTAATPSEALGELLDQGRAWLEDNFSEEDIAALAQVDQQQLLAQLQPIVRAFDEGEFNDLAAVRAQAVQVLAWLRTQPWGKPYADWLAPRMDYLDVAVETENATRQQWAIEQARNPAATPGVPPPSPTLRFQVVRERVQRNAQSKSVWARRVAQHAPPARAAELAPAMKEIFRTEGVPPEMIWLAEVESSFDPDARSPVGACGLFQFMPATAKRFGLSTFPLDERTNPAKSAKAAAQYLRALHGRFRDWPLVLAAYNAGEGRVGRALDASKTRSFDAIAPQLPAETRLYVPKVMATVAAREGVDPFALPAPTALPVAPAAPIAAAPAVPR